MEIRVPTRPIGKHTPAIGDDLGLTPSPRRFHGSFAPCRSPAAELCETHHDDVGASQEKVSKNQTM